MKIHRGFYFKLLTCGQKNCNTNCTFVSYVQLKNIPSEQKNCNTNCTFVSYVQLKNIPSEQKLHSRIPLLRESLKLKANDLTDKAYFGNLGNTHYQH